MNVTAYIVYLLLTYFITVHVGMQFYRHGRIFILQLFQRDTAFTDFINRLLLTGYYLLNLGYAALMLRNWKTVHNMTELLVTVSIATGRILLTLALIHYCNMMAIAWLGKHRKLFTHHKN